MKLFDAHCHLQDPKIISKTQQLIKTAQDRGVVFFAVNGVCEQDWDSVKQLSETHPSVVPCFGLHPWFVIFHNFQFNVIQFSIQCNQAQTRLQFEVFVIYKLYIV